MNFPSDPPAERLMEGHAWGDRPRFGRYNTFTYYGKIRDFHPKTHKKI